MNKNLNDKENSSSINNKKHELTGSKRNAILQSLLQWCKDGVLHRGAITDIAKKFNVGRNTVARI